MLPFETVRYEFLSFPGITINLPARHYDEAVRCLKGTGATEALEEFPTLRRFLHHVRAFGAVVARFGVDWREAARDAGIPHVLDYFVLQTCERRVKPFCFSESGETLAAVMKLYSNVSSACDRLENSAITEAVQMDLGIRRLRERLSGR